MQRSKLKSCEQGYIKKHTAGRTRLDGRTWTGGITCHPILCPMGKKSPPDNGLVFPRVFTWRKKAPQDLVSSHGLSAAYFEATTTRHAEPAPPSLLLICLPRGQDFCIFPSSRWMGFWMGRVKFQLDPAAPVPLLPSTCSLGGAWLAPPMTADDSNIL